MVNLCSLLQPLSLGELNLAGFSRASVQRKHKKSIRQQSISTAPSAHIDYCKCVEDEEKNSLALWRKVVEGSGYRKDG